MSDEKTTEPTFVPLETVADCESAILCCVAAYYEHAHDFTKAKNSDDAALVAKYAAKLDECGGLLFDLECERRAAARRAQAALAGSPPFSPQTLLEKIRAEAEAEAGRLYFGKDAKP